MAKRQMSAIGAVAGLVLSVPVLAAVPVQATAGLTTDDCPSQTVRSLSPGDVDGDGFGDTVVGVPRGAGLVDVTYAANAMRPRYQLSETSIGLASTATPTVNGFGYAVTLADLNADVCDDYVVGAPGTINGAVDLILSGPTGPQGPTAVRLNAPSVPHPLLAFGHSVAVSQRSSALVDLWVGAPGAWVGNIPGAGAVYHYAVAKGDTLVPQLVGVITEPHPAVGDGFGGVLSVNRGLTNTSGGAKDAVLMVSAPYRTVGGHRGAGEVTWIRCDSVTGATSAVLTLNQNSPGVPGVAEADDHFGAAISQPPVGYTSLIGIPGEDIGSLRDAGLVQPVVLHMTGSRSIPPPLGQDSPSVPGVAESGDQFGAAVLVNPSYPTNDVAAIGSPGEAVGSVAGAGMVQYLPLGTSTFRPITLTQGDGGLGDRIEAGDHVGGALSTHLISTDGAGTPHFGPLIGAPGESTTGSLNAGIVEFSTGPDTSLGPFHLVGYSGGPVGGLLYGRLLAHV